MPPRLIVCPSCANLARPSETRCPSCDARLRLPTDWAGPIAPAAMVLMGLAVATCSDDGDGGEGGAGGVMTTSEVTNSVVAGYTHSISVGPGGAGGEGGVGGAGGAAGAGGTAGAGGAGGGN